MTQVPVGQYARSTDLDRSEDFYAVKCVDPNDRTKDEVFLWKPNVTAICEPLTGVSEVDPDTRKICGVIYPRPLNCVRIYRKALDVVKKFKDRDDIFVLALHRRYIIADSSEPYVPIQDMMLDDEFFEHIESVTPALSACEWKMVARYLPDGSRFKANCLALSSLQGLTDSVREAAS